MVETKKSRSRLFWFLELLRDLTVFIDLEWKLAIAELRRNLVVTKQGVIQMTVGLFLLLLALVLLACSAIAALAIVLPLWLAFLLIGVLLAASGLLFLLTGKIRLSKVSPLPRDSIERIRVVSRKIKAVSSR